MIVLTLEESSEEYIAGFPKYVTFSTSKLATVYYTLDGSTPNQESLIAVNSVYLPNNGRSVMIKAMAISIDDQSSVLEVEYKTDSTNIDGPWISGNEGVVVLPFEAEVVDSLSYNSEGESAQEVSVDVSDLDIKASRNNSKGIMLDPQKTTMPFVNFAIVTNRDLETIESSPNNNAEFDPSAKFIIIDGSSDEAFENQVVKIVNRPYNTIGPSSNFYKERLGQKEPIITGNYVRSFYNPKTGIYISYYWESLESRWVKSIQRVSRDQLKLSWRSEHPFVFRWIQDRSLSQLF